MPDTDHPRGAGGGDVPQAWTVPLAAVDGSCFVAGPDGRIRWVNASFLRTTGYPPDACLGVLRSELITGPFTRTADFERLHAELAGGAGTRAQFVTRTADGRPYWVELDVRPVVEDGVVVAQVGIEWDVTARRQAEERARQALVRAESLAVALRHEKRLLTGVLSTIPHVVWWKSEELRYVGCNPAYLALRGLRSPADVVGRLEGQLDCDDDLGTQLALMERTVLEHGEPVVDATIRSRSPQGDVRSFLVSVLPQDGGGVIGVGTDITRVTELERQLAQATRLESIGQLAAGIAHEINTPVQYVSDNTRFLRDAFTDVLDGLREIAALADGPPSGDGTDDDDPRARLREVLAGLDLDFVADEVPSALGQSLEGLERVAQIVRAMKDFSHPGTGRVDTDLNRVVESTVQVSRNEWKYLATLELDLAPDVGLVPCFEGELKQVVLNIVVNAAQSIEERRRAEGTEALGRITVATRRSGGQALIVITDDGVGMDEEVQRRAFDPFFTTKELGQGTGQGLSLAHSTVVSKHGGRIDVRSAPGEGATFTVALPLDVAVGVPEVSR